jgi:hypothetical protein
MPFTPPGWAPAATLRENDKTMADKSLWDILVLGSPVGPDGCSMR